MMRNAATARTWPSRSGAKARPPAARCRGCALSGAQLCRKILDAPPAGAHRPVLRRFRRGEPIALQGEPCGFLGVIRSGYARKSVTRVSGRRILLDLVIPGEIVGRLPDQLSASDIEAATDVEICLHDRVAVTRQMLDNRDFRMLILREHEDKRHRALGAVWRHGMLTSRERIMASLVAATRIMPTEPLPDGGLVLDMTIERRDWADLTNTAVETISRTLRFLEEKELVISLTPRRFRIRDLDVLATLAGEEPRRQQGVRQDRSARAESHRSA